ncbi:hypothetical protein ACRAWF_18845 [Streptomyces sp. L7]
MILPNLAGERSPAPFRWRSGSADTHVRAGTRWRPAGAGGRCNRYYGIDYAAIGDSAIAEVGDRLGTGSGLARLCAERAGAVQGWPPGRVRFSSGSRGAGDR